MFTTRNNESNRIAKLKRRNMLVGICCSFLLQQETGWLAGWLADCTTRTKIKFNEWPAPSSLVNAQQTCVVLFYLHST